MCNGAAAGDAAVVKTLPTFNNNQREIPLQGTFLLLWRDSVMRWSDGNKTRQPNVDIVWVALTLKGIVQ